MSASGQHFHQQNASSVGMPSGGDGLDPSDFPALGSSTRLLPPPMSNSSSIGNSNFASNSDFSMDDFPALPGAPGHSRGGGSNQMSNIGLGSSSQLGNLSSSSLSFNQPSSNLQSSYHLQPTSSGNMGDLSQMQRSPFSNSASGLGGFMSGVGGNHSLTQALNMNWPGNGSADFQHSMGGKSNFLRGSGLVGPGSSMQPTSNSGLSYSSLLSTINSTPHNQNTASRPLGPATSATGSLTGNEGMGQIGSGLLDFEKSASKQSYAKTAGGIGGHVFSAPTSTSFSGTNGLMSTPESNVDSINGTSVGGVLSQSGLSNGLSADPTERYGLLGLLEVIRMTDADLSMLALGSDLTTLGLNLNAAESLSSTFISPWADTQNPSGINIEPEFNLPSCYSVPNTPNAASKLRGFSDETLLYIFYSLPRDVLQEAVAQELYNRNWRFHKELKLWLTKEEGSEPFAKTQSYERGTYIFFDPNNWEKVKKEYMLMYDSLEERTGTGSTGGLNSSFGGSGLLGNLGGPPSSLTSALLGGIPPGHSLPSLENQTGGASAIPGGPNNSFVFNNNNGSNMANPPIAGQGLQRF
ncbi:hypothetical protein BZG36_00927 [Bifiguratus adelaidae]|uniref:NOT2/NOT3/NOT5 C-terminal domain-containing protein n=1 Tax=Bifiguratus adelaidae TaxID=1938954 RepID=A0A261Y5V1_9FUNG|nr:hypothetical protein BZG36_00927 [Bifiguratus adelaidae]